MIRRSKVDVFIDRLFCDECKLEMTYQNMLFTEPVKFMYSCPSCEKSMVFDDKFPRQVFFEEFKEWI